MRDIAAVQMRVLPVLLVLILLASAALRLIALDHPQYHPDQHIPERVALTILESGTLDTNWVRAGMEEYQRPQYNFSAYILSVAALIKAARLFPGFDEMSVQTLLRLYSMILGVGVTLLTYLLAQRLFGRTTALVAALLAAVNPLLYQDSLYPRPETFATVLTLIFALLLCAPSPGKLRLFAAALVAGLLVATKISTIVLLPWLFLASTAQTGTDTLLGDLILYLKRSLACLNERLALVIFGCLAGFAAGAPYVFTDVAGFLEGLRALAQQYNRGHWPHGLASGTTLERLAYAGAYFTYTGGVAILTLSAIGAAGAAHTRNFFALAIFATAVAVAIQFGTYAAFFERNVSHVWPLILIFSAFGITQLAALLSLEGPWRRTAALILGTAVTVAPAALTTSAILSEEVMGGQVRRLDAARAALAHKYLAQNLTLSWNPDAFNARGFPPCQPLVIDVAFPSHDRPGDEAAERADGYTRVGYLPSAFPGVPTSTLDVYFTPATLFLYRDVKIEACPAGAELMVSRKYVGDPLTVTAADADLGWERGHMPPEVAPPFAPDKSYASWSQADEHLGRILFEVETAGEASIVLGYVTGQIAKSQSIEVRDATTQRVIWAKAPVAPSPAWSFQVIALPGGTERIVVEAMDGGASWSEWMGIEPPRKLVGLAAR